MVCWVKPVNGISQGNACVNWLGPPPRQVRCWKTCRKKWFLTWQLVWIEIFPSPVSVVSLDLKNLICPIICSLFQGALSWSEIPTTSCRTWTRLTKFIHDDDNPVVMRTSTIYIYNIEILIQPRMNEASVFFIKRWKYFL